MNSKILIVASNYYEEVSDNLIEGAKLTLSEFKKEYDIIYSPGCYEIPFLIKKNIEKYEGFIALGCIIRGETYHFDLIANECSRKIIDLSVEFVKPIGFGILTCENKQQALVRSSIDKKNKGREAALACIKTL